MDGEVLEVDHNVEITVVVEIVQGVEVEAGRVGVEDEVGAVDRKGSGFDNILNHNGQACDASGPLHCHKPSLMRSP